jgi:hypothetical protein
LPQSHRDTEKNKDRKGDKETKGRDREIPRTTKFFLGFISISLVVPISPLLTLLIKGVRHA